MEHSRTTSARVIPAFIAVILLSGAILLQQGTAQKSTKQKRPRVEYVCPPCGCRGDDTYTAAQGDCGICGMDLVEKSTTLALDAMPNFRKVNDTVWTGGQPTLLHLRKLKEGGIRTIVNLRMPSEHEAAKEETKAKELGIAYVNVPVDYNAPKAADVDSFLQVTDAALKRGPVFIHCAAAIRVGSFWMVRRVVRDGWEYDRAREEATRIGLRNYPQWVSFADSTIAKRRGVR